MRDKLDKCQEPPYIAVQQWIEGPTPADAEHRKEDHEVHANRGTESRPGGWGSPEPLYPNILHDRPGFLSQRCAESPTSILSVSTRPHRPESQTRLTPSSTASANSTRSCPRCRQALTNAFGIPPEWWSVYYQNANGYFGCLEQDVAGIPTIGASSPLPPWPYRLV